MGVRTYRRKDGSEGLIHIANIGVRDVCVRANGRVHHAECFPGFIIRRLDERNRPVGKPFCNVCKNTLGRKALSRYRDSARSGGTEVRWEFIPHGARFKGSKEYLEGNHQSLYLAPREIRPITLAEVRGEHQVPEGAQSKKEKGWEVPPHVGEAIEKLAKAIEKLPPAIAKAKISGKNRRPRPRTWAEARFLRFLKRLPVDDPRWERDVNEVWEEWEKQEEEHRRRRLARRELQTSTSPLRERCRTSAKEISRQWRYHR